VSVEPQEDRRAADAHRAAAESLVARSVALVGFMGVGKSSVGRELAALLDRPFVDTDGLVEQRAGMTIPELFRLRGEQVFRAFELEAVRQVLALPACVVALGGGAFGQPAVARLLLEHTLVVHLYTPWRHLRDVLPELTLTRPLLEDREPWEVEDLFLRRAGSYRRAHLRITLPRSTPAEAAELVAAVLRRAPAQATLQVVD
jgi:shikimate kinase